MNSNQTENQSAKSSILNEFLWTCAGVNKAVLRQCPSDYAKYAGIGGTILFTALMAMLSGGYAMYFVFESTYIAIAFGIFWGLLIFNLDRFIVNTMYSDGKHNISWAEFQSGLPRIIMAIFLGLVISTPLEMKIFSDQIDSQLLEDNGNRIEKGKGAYQSLYDELDKYETRKHDIEAKGQELQERLLEAQEDLRKEAEGSALSGKIGFGPIYRAKKQYVSECQATVNNWESTNRSRIIQLDSDIERVKEEINRQEAQIKKDAVQNGFAVRYEAFKNATNPSEHTSLYIVSIMITLLFVIIETAPTFFKMMMEDGPYDDLLRAEKHKIKVLSDKRISDVNDEVNTSVRISTMKNEKRLEAETIANQHILEKIARAQAELLETAINEWKTIELEKIRQNPSNYVVSLVPSQQEREMEVTTDTYGNLLERVNNRGIQGVATPVSECSMTNDVNTSSNTVDSNNNEENNEDSNE
jgi:hypothetical protein